MTATTAIMPMMAIIKLAMILLLLLLIIIIIIIIIINVGNNITCSINLNYEIAAKLCTLATFFFPGV
jgi:hypothetical protein